MTSSPHSRTITELAESVEHVLRDNGCVDDCGCETWDALRELRSRAEQQPPNPDIAPEVWARSNRLIRDRAERTEAAERERDHMRAALERIVSAYSDENEEFLADTVFTTARDALSQPGTEET